MIEINNTDELHEVINRNQIVIAEIGTATCSPCAAIRLKLETWLKDHREVKGVYVSVEKNPDIAAAEGIFSAPAVIVYTDGRQALRECGYFSLETLLEKTERYMNLLK